MKSTLSAMAAAVALLPAGAHAGSMGRMAAGHARMSGAHETFPFGHPGRAARVDRVIRISATDFRFSPAAIRVRAGETVKFVITNRSALAHEFVLGTVAEQKAHEAEMAAMASHPGETMQDPNGVAVPKGHRASLVWTFTRPMTIQYACHVPGHYAAGMYGTLTIVKR